MRLIILLSITLFYINPSEGQISQLEIKGSNSNRIYQNFIADRDGVLDLLTVSTDNSGMIEIQFYENPMSVSADNPFWSLSTFKSAAGELTVDLSKGEGLYRQLEKGKSYSFSVYGAGNIHHSFLKDVYPGGNYRFEDGIERTGDLFFEFRISENQESFFKKEKDLAPANDITVYPNPTTGKLTIKGLHEDANVDVYTNTGSRVSNHRLYDGKIDLSDLTNGIYYLIIEGTQSKRIKKVVKANY